MTIAARFEHVADVRAAVEDLPDGGTRVLEILSPHPVPELEPLVDPRPSRMGWVVFTAALLGAAAALLIQWLTTVDLPLNVGGRPVSDWPAFVVITFETAILVGGLTAFVGFFVVTRLPRFHHPTWDLQGIEHASRDSYWVIVESASAESVTEVMESHGGKTQTAEVFR